MTGRGTIAAEFRDLAARRFGFLAEHGFSRTPAAELDTPVGASVVFAGRNVGLLIGLDTRDRRVEVRVTRARAGSVVESGPDGYTANLVGHLVTHAGYRGGGPRGGSEPAVDRAALERLLGAWADFVRSEGRTLLADDDAAIPPPA